MNAPQKTHDADDETLEYIADLEQRNAKLDSALREATEQQFFLHADVQERCRALELSARKSAEQLEDLKAALRFYADSENYKPRILDGVDIVIIPVCDDRGEIARQSLKERAT